MSTGKCWSMIRVRRIACQVDVKNNKRMAAAILSARERPCALSRALFYGYLLTFCCLRGDLPPFFDNHHFLMHPKNGEKMMVKVRIQNLKVDDQRV